MNEKRLLIVEDEKPIADILAYGFRKEGFTVQCAHTGAEGLKLAQDQRPDLVLLDWMLPDLSGVDVCRLLTEKYNIPIVMLTARSSVDDKLLGLETGADYYLVKPFHMQELLAVVRVMARKYTDTRTNVYTIADLSVDVSAHTVVRAGRVIELTSREYALLEYMIRNKGVVLSRERIENNLWNYDYEGGTNVVDVYVGYLRKKIDTGFSKKLIHTVWGTGWVLRED